MESVSNVTFCERACCCRETCYAMAQSHKYSFKRPHPVGTFQNNSINISPNKYLLHHVPKSLGSNSSECIYNGYEEGEIEVTESKPQRPKCNPEEIENEEDKISTDENDEHNNLSDDSCMHTCTKVESKLRIIDRNSRIRETITVEYPKTLNVSLALYDCKTKSILSILQKSRENLEYFIKDVKYCKGTNNKLKNEIVYKKENENYSTLNNQLKNFEEELLISKTKLLVLKKSLENIKKTDSKPEEPQLSFNNNLDVQETEFKMMQARQVFKQRMLLKEILLKFTTDKLIKICNSFYEGRLKVESQEDAEFYLLQDLTVEGLVQSEMFEKEEILKFLIEKRVDFSNVPIKSINRWDLMCGFRTLL